MELRKKSTRKQSVYVFKNITLPQEYRLPTTSKGRKPAFAHPKNQNQDGKDGEKFF